MYSGYYYFLTLLFIGVGIYNLTSTGWLKSIRLCCREERPPSLTCANDDVPLSSGTEDDVELDEPASSDTDDDSECEPTDYKPLIQDKGRLSIMSKPVDSLHRPV